VTPTARSSLTLAVLVLLMAVGALWGWQAFTAPFPEAEDPAPCVDTEVEKGDRVTTEDVLVNVLNGSGRQGLASATMADFTNRGFAPGSTGNADEDLPPDSGVQVISDDRRDPAAQLVLRQFRGGQIVRGDSPDPGITVVMGNAFQEMGPPVNAVRARAATTYCRSTGITVEGAP
jgi:hypothetical protein